jgi:hypothetical protein
MAQLHRSQLDSEDFIKLLEEDDADKDLGVFLVHRAGFCSRIELSEEQLLQLSIECEERAAQIRERRRKG